MNRYFVVLTVALLSTTSPLKAMDFESPEEQARLSHLKNTNYDAYMEEIKRLNAKRNLGKTEKFYDTLKREAKGRATVLETVDQTNEKKGEELVLKTKELHKKAKRETVEDSAKKHKEKIRTIVKNKLYYKAVDGQSCLRLAEEIQFLESNLSLLIKSLRKQERIACGSMEDTLLKLSIKPFDQMRAAIEKIIKGNKALARLEEKKEKEKKEKEKKEDSNNKSLRDRIFDKIKKFAYEERIISDDPTFGDIVTTIHFFNDMPRSYLSGPKSLSLLEALHNQSLENVYEHLDIHPQSPVSRKRTDEASAAREAVENLISTKETGIVFLPTASNGPSSNNALIKLLRGRSGATHYFFYNAKNLTKKHSEHDLYQRIQNDEFILVTSTAAHAHYVFAMPKTEGDILHLCSTSKSFDSETERQIVDMAILEWYPKSPEAKDLREQLRKQVQKQREEAKNLENLQMQGDLIGELMGKSKDLSTKTTYRKPNKNQDPMLRKKKNPQPIETTRKRVKVELNSTGLAQNIEYLQDGTITVITDNNASASYQLASHRLDVIPGQKIIVPYGITVQDGGIMSIGLLNTARNGWLSEIVLQAGLNQAGVMEVIVPEGETETSLVFRNYHLGTPGQTTFTIENFDIQKGELEITLPTITTVEDAEHNFKLNPITTTSNRITRANGKIRVETDHNADASYQLESERIDVKAGHTIRVPYKINVEEGGKIALGLLNTYRNGWLKEVVLGPGQHESVFETIVPEGEILTSLVFRNYHLGTPGKTTFTIENFDIQKGEFDVALPEIIVEEDVDAKFKLNTPDTTKNSITRANGKIRVETDHNADASYQLESERIDVKAGQTIRVPYKINVEKGGKIALGLLNTNRNGWLKEVVLGPGPHENVFETIVPEGEELTSLVFRNYHLGTPGQSIFTIENFDIQKEEAINPNSVPQKILSGEEIPVKLNPTGKSQRIDKEEPSNDQRILVTTDYSADANYQLESERFPVEVGKILSIHYDIIVEDGGIMALGLLNTNRNGWYGEELVLRKGQHKGVLERIVLQGEEEASLVFRNYHLETAGQTTFLIQNIDLRKK